ncbi:undecaprenyl/decaprenyl-phosphate alpha-N-acetylglucosaminyl 1-phosphate transferase [Clostridium bornimense]|uniref:MraY family glycosyltransferase n=1 Tax=Clostridium bornimense TaxID=1216932 RepID=UPI001C10BF95|nr:MraY family glycosyltransferase [Clostridium bornimense]MBU5314944.1 undecaprenyl/decaprenyl-phosphate alpha-N-acetylglucosaminyl 1-phosphate transferase [Clostridium bornimense]
MTSIFLITIAAFISCITVPFVKVLAKKIGAIDEPTGGRRIHKKPMPRLGGLSIYISFIITMTFFTESIGREEICIMIGATVIVIGGIIDDIKELSPKWKFMFQIIASIILIVGNIKISIVSNPFNSNFAYFNISYLSIPLTIFWVVGITNAFNFSDGLDGLCAGMGFISSFTVFLIALSNGRGEAAALIIVLAGGILGFLPYNFNPASIFLGDTGAQLIGFLIASISMVGTLKYATVFTIAVPILAIGIPILDTAFAMIRRKINGRSMFSADKGHLHHRLLKLGLSQRKAVSIMYLINGGLSIIAVIAMELKTNIAYILFAITISIIIIIGWKLSFFRMKE